MENKIVIGKGLGRVQFGLDRDDVLEILGQPTEKELSIFIRYVLQPLMFIIVWLLGIFFSLVIFLSKYI